MAAETHTSEGIRILTAIFWLVDMPFNGMFSVPHCGHIGSTRIIRILTAIFWLVDMTFNGMFSVPHCGYIGSTRISEFTQTMFCVAPSRGCANCTDTAGTPAAVRSIPLLGQRPRDPLLNSRFNWLSIRPWLANKPKSRLQ